MLDLSSGSSDSGSGSADGGAPSLAVSVVCAILSPLVLAVVNLLDKIATDRRVRSTLAYTAYIGAVEIAVGAVECASVPWANVRAGGAALLVWPVAAGVAYGLFMYLYFFAMRITDASVLVGLMYIYPAVVCVLSYAVLGERLGAMGYSAVAVLLLGAVVLSLDLPRALVRRCCARSTLLVESEAQRQRRVAQEARIAAETAKGDHGCWTPCGPCVSSCSSSSSASSSSSVALDDALPAVSGSRSHSGKDYGDGDDEGETDSALDAMVVSVDGKELEDEEEEQDAESKKDEPEAPGTTTECKCVPPSLRLVLVGLPIVLLLGGYEFMLAFATKGGMTTFQVSGVEMCTQGAVLLLGLAASGDARRALVREVRWNWLFGALNALLTVASQLLMVFALAALPASVVSALCAMQPLDILVLETAARVSGARVSQCVAFKLVPILFVIAGVVLLSVRVFVDV